MKIKLITLMSGPDGTHQPGDEIEIDARRGRQLVDGDFAIEIKPKRAETAVARKSENTAMTPSAEDEARQRLDAIAIAEAAAKAQGSEGPLPAAAAAGDETPDAGKTGLFGRLVNKITG